MSQPEVLKRGMEKAHRNRREANRVNQEHVRSIIQEMRRLGVEWTDKEILRQAGLHRSWFHTEANWPVRDEARAARAEIRGNALEAAMARKSSMELTLQAENAQLLDRIRELEDEKGELRSALKEARKAAIEGFDPTPLHDALNRQGEELLRLQDENRKLETRLRTAEADRKRDKHHYEDIIRELRERIPDA